MTLNSTSGAQTYALVNDDDNRGVAHGYENTGIVRVGDATGFIVGDHQIATAAHCVYDSDCVNTNKISPSIDVETYDRSGLPTGTKLTVAEIHMPEYYTSGNLLFDYALITVVEDLSDYVHFNIGNSYNMKSDEVGTIPIHVTGKPLYTDDNLETENCDNILYTHYGNIYGSNNKSLLYYTVDVSGGQSGSPVYTITRETYNNNFYYTYTALAVHTNSGSGEYNFGTLMTKHHQMFYKNNPNANYQ